MTINDVITLAQGGELKGLAVKSDNETIVGYINLGLIELYKRFPIKTNEYIITLTEDTEIYTMPDDFMYIVAAYGEVDAYSDDTVNILAINEEDNPLSINTINWNQIQIPVNIDGEYISLIYAASPEFLSVDDLTATVPIPPQMVEALLHYMGYRAHSSVNGEIQAENSTHYTRFDASCARISTLGLFTSDDLNMDRKFSSRGFV